MQREEARLIGTYLIDGLRVKGEHVMDSMHEEMNHSEYFRLGKPLFSVKDKSVE